MKVIVGGLIFVAGSGIGFGVGWYLTKKKYEAMMDDEIEEQVEETKRYYKELIDQNRKEPVGEVVKDTPHVEKQESYTDRMNRRRDDLLRSERVQYETYSVKENHENPNDIYREVDEEVLRNNDDNPSTDIFYITPDQFAREEYRYDKVTLYWWELNRVLTDEDLATVDVPEVIGLGFEQHIGRYETDMVYVRNRNMETDYEVIVKHDDLYSVRDE